MLCGINISIDFCLKNNRTLLIDVTNTCFNINLADYFHIVNNNISIITDIKIIKDIINDKTLTIYPDSITDRNLDNWKFVWTPNNGAYTLNNILLTFPTNQCYSDIIIISRCGGGAGIHMFKNLFFKQNIVDHINQEFTKLPLKYLAIQIRNTDIKCDYVSLYDSNKEVIHSYNTIYVATDDKKSLEFFRSKNLNILNFTEFPEIYNYNLHRSSISGDIKIKNILCDIYIIAMADKLLSCSKGGFIRLVNDIRKDITIITNKVS